MIAKDNNVVTFVSDSSLTNSQKGHLLDALSSFGKLIRNGEIIEFSTLANRIVAKYSKYPMFLDNMIVSLRSIH